jgi:hypothetical protein
VYTQRSARRIEGRCYTRLMDRVEEIEAAIHELPPDQYRRLAEWFREFEQTRWDARMDEDFLFEEVDSELAQGSLREWPPRK